MAQDLTGQKFGKLTIKCKYGVSKGRHIIYSCICDCGKEKEILGIHLKSKKIVSCGCYRKEINSQIIKHGCNRVGKRTGCYQSWADMKNRCSNINHDFWLDYGGKGIKVCDRWKNFINFFEDMGERPENHSIERIDRDGNYCPENCIWADIITQSNNRSDNIIIEHQGKKQTLTQWSKELNFPYETLRARLKRGWSEEKTLTEPLRANKGKIYDKI